MITYTITGDTIEISDAVRTHIEKRFEGLEHFMHPKADHQIAVTASKTTAHAREDMYKVEARLKLHHEEVFASAEESDLYAAIDKAREELVREISSNKDRHHTLLHEGARKIKALAKEEEK